MRRKLITALLLSSIMMAMPATASAESITEVETESDVLQTIPAFNGYSWGTSLDDIIAGEITDNMIEGTDYGLPHDGDQMLTILNDEVAGFDATVFYSFTESDELVKGLYILSEKHANDNKYYDDYLSLVRKLQSLYGEGNAYEKWSNDLFKDDPDDIGIAIASEGVTFLHKWTAEDGSVINCMCYGDNYEITVGVQYNAPADLQTPATENTSGL